MNEDARHLFICSVGPVQDFIATARTSQDLWFGSWMLSELSKSATRVIFDKSYQLISPAPEQRQDLAAGSDLSVANKIVAVISGKPEMVAESVWQAIHKQLKQLYEETFARIRGGIDRDLAEKQIFDLVEFYWVSVPYTNPQDYKKVRSQAEALLAARKNTREFEFVCGCRGLPKSSLDGFRESVLPKNVSLMNADQLYHTFRVEQGEQLSGIDLLKRWGKIEVRNFCSTTDIAALPFLAMLGSEREQRLLQDIKSLLREYTQHGDETDGAHFYVERLRQLISDKSQKKEFSKRFTGIFKANGISHRPAPYYVLLLADGDNVGRTIDAQDSVEKYQHFSQRLSAFAQQAKKIITESQGVPVYVGGDDILAYLPLHMALSCIFNLNKEFNQVMQEFSFMDDIGKHSPTLSGGLVIAHHLTPLQDVLDMARRAEKLAKSVEGKNALTVISSKRGGVARSVSAKMNVLIERMRVLIRYIRQKQISSGTAYELQKLHRQLKNEISDAKVLSEVIPREALRVIQHKREVGGKQEVSQEILDQFEVWLKNENFTLDEISQEMIIASEFAGAYELASVS